MEAIKTSFEKRTAIMVLIILGWIVCAYLVFRTTQLNGNAPKIPDLCAVIFGKSCDDILSNRFSQIFGFPFAGIGLAYFGLLGLLFSFRKLVFDRLVLLISGLGLGASVFLSYLLIKGELACILCQIIHFINLGILIFLLIGSKNSSSSLVVKPNGSMNFYLRWSLFLLMLISIGGFSQYLLFRTSVKNLTSVNLDEVAKEFQLEKVNTIPFNDKSPLIGSEKAPVQIVVFSSFQCPACKTIGPILENVSRKFGEEIGITFKHFPLSSDCNPSLQFNMQPQSCNAAFAAIAAQQQNLFWEYHDQLFQSDLNFDEATFKSIAEKIGLNIEKWETDRQSATTNQLLIEDLKIALEIGINATPSVFINGRLLKNFQESALIYIIEDELKKNSK